MVSPGETDSGRGVRRGLGVQRPGQGRLAGRQLFDVFGVAQKRERLGPGPYEVVVDSTIGCAGLWMRAAAMNLEAMRMEVSPRWGETLAADVAAMRAL